MCLQMVMARSWVFVEVVLARSLCGCWAALRAPSATPSRLVIACHNTDLEALSLLLVYCAHVSWLKLSGGMGCASARCASCGGRSRRVERHVCGAARHLLGGVRLRRRACQGSNSFRVSVWPEL